MTFQHIYNLTIKYFPSEIDISDGKILENGAESFNTLFESWQDAESKAENDSNIMQLMVWNIFCTIHKKAIENFSKGKKTVSISELDMKYLKKRVEENLFHLNISLNPRK